MDFNYFSVSLVANQRYEGYILHARQVNSNPPKIVGRFIDLPRRSNALTCLQGLQKDNTVMDRGREILLTNMTFTWIGPDMDMGEIEFL